MPTLTADAGQFSAPIEVSEPELLQGSQALLENAFHDGVRAA